MCARKDENIVEKMLVDNMKQFLKYVFIKALIFCIC